MIKSQFTLVLSMSFFLAIAQKKDTSVFYIAKSGKMVSTRDSADYFVVILPPDTTIDKNLFIVNEFYKSGKTLLIGKSFNNDLDFKFESSRIIFFENGHKSEVSTFENGRPIGDMIEYYPNGKLLSIRTFTPGKPTFYSECRDSTGAAMTLNGNGHWIFYFGRDFHSSYEEGNVVNGHQDGKWIARRNNVDAFINEYKDGKFLSEKILNQELYSQMVRVQQDASFPGGNVAFLKFIEHNIKYPEIAKKNGTQGKVTVSFIVETDGSLSNVTIENGIGDGCNEEAIRIIKLSPRWTPGIKDSKAIQTRVTVPVIFTIPK